MCNPHRTARTCEGVGRADGHNDASHREVRQGQAHDEHVGHLERKVGEDERSLLDFSFAPQGTMFICQKGGEEIVRSNAWRACLCRLQLPTSSLCHDR